LRGCEECEKATANANCCANSAVRRPLAEKNALHERPGPAPSTSQKAPKMILLHPLNALTRDEAGAVTVDCAAPIAAIAGQDTVVMVSAS
jgi:hypothetical protein